MPPMSAQNGRETVMNNDERKVHLVGAGIASLASAAYLIKDGGFDGENIKIYEQDYIPGGCLDRRWRAQEGLQHAGRAHVRAKITSHVRPVFVYPHS